jgi:hypothetical protein
MKSTIPPLEGSFEKAILSETSPEMTALVRNFDWAKTPLGPISSWSHALYETVENLLGNGFGMLLWWGPEHCQIYNDAYRPVLGEKHPASLGQPASECWPEIWERIGPLIHRPFRTGSPSVVTDFRLMPNRHGFQEDAYFTFAYSPVFDSSAPGGIGGVMATVYETTGNVIAERRMRTLSELSATTAKATSEPEICAFVANVLKNASRDAPFTLLYLIEPDTRTASLQARTGIAECEVPREVLKKLASLC